MANKTEQKRIFLCALTGMLISLSAAYGIAKKTDLFDGNIRARLADRELKVPSYNWVKLSPGNCSGYARMAAMELFGKKYSFSDAWDRIYNDKVVCKAENKDLTELVNNGVLKPGMIAGVYCPRSFYNDKKDMAGNPVSFTHVMLYLGQDSFGEPVFTEQFRTKTQIRRLGEFSEDGLEARFVIDSKE